MGQLDFPFGANVEKKKVAKKSAKKPAKGFYDTKKRKLSGVTAEQFVTAYKKIATKKGTLDDLAAELGMTKQNCAARKAIYQKAGVKFPQLKRKSTKTIDVEKLQAILGRLSAYN